MYSTVEEMDKIWGLLSPLFFLYVLYFEKAHLCTMPDRRLHVPQIHDAHEIGTEPNLCTSV